MARNFSYEGLSETIQVRDAHQFDVGILTDYLRTKLDGVGNVIEVLQMRAGQSNPTYLLRCGGVEWVLRKKPPGVLLPSAHAVEREYRVQAALIDTDVPVARMLHLCEDPDVIGTPFYIMERMVGRVFHVNSVPDVTPQERAQIWDVMNDVLARIHRVDWAAHGLSDFGKPGNYFARQISRWTKQYIASETEKINEMNSLIDWLPNNIPGKEETSIVHGDYRLDNMVLHKQKAKVLAVLDWELSTLGHPLGDFTYHLMQWFMPGDGSAAGTQTLSNVDLKTLGIPTAEDYTKMYCDFTNRSGIENIDFYLAYNFFRLAGILQGIIGRVRDGTAASEHAEDRADRVRPLAEAGWLYAKKAGAS